MKNIVGGDSGLDPEKTWQEIEKHAFGRSEKLDLDELDAISGGADRDWAKEGCAATCEWNSWCAANDYCVVFAVTYDNFWDKCPDGHEHEWANGGYTCRRCGYFSAHDHKKK